MILLHINNQQHQDPICPRYTSPAYLADGLNLLNTILVDDHLGGEILAAGAGIRHDKCAFSHLLTVEGPKQSIGEVRTGLQSQ